MADKGAIVEFDFTALNGAEVLYGVAKRYLKELDGIVLDVPLEARHLAGGSYQDGLAELFKAVKTKKTAAKSARELAELFRDQVTKRLPAAVTQGFRNFVKTLVEAGVKVVVATRADVEASAVREAFGDLLGDRVVLYGETSGCYGAVKWDAWRLACASNRIHGRLAVAVTGSGFGVKAALLAGLRSLAVVNDHVAYQDFGGADEVVASLDTAAARKVLSLLRLE